MKKILGETPAEGYFASFVSEEDMQGKNGFPEPAAPVTDLKGEESWASKQEGHSRGRAILIVMTQT